MKAFLCGQGAWQPGFPNLSSWLTASPSSQTVPVGRGLAAALKRRATQLSRMVCDAYSDAIDGSTCDESNVAIVVASALGEVVATISLLEMMTQGTGMVSPTLFHNSVHNTAAGYLSIAKGNRQGCSAVAAGGNSLAAGFLEALLLLTPTQDAIVIAAEEAGPAPFDCVAQANVGAFAYWLSLRPQGLCHAISLRLDAQLPSQGSPAFDGTLPYARELSRALATQNQGHVCIGVDQDIDLATWLEFANRESQ